MITWEDARRYADYFVGPAPILSWWIIAVLVAIAVAILVVLYFQNEDRPL